MTSMMRDDYATPWRPKRDGEHALRRMSRNRLLLMMPMPQATSVADHLAAVSESVSGASIMRRKADNSLMACHFCRHGIASLRRISR